MRAAWARCVRSPWLLVTAVLMVPILVWTIRLIADGWIPQNDEALIAVRAHDVFSIHVPFLGMRSTSGIDAPGVHVYHPGPLQFYALAIPYLLSGFHAWGLLVGAFLLAAALVGMGLWGAWTIDRWRSLLPVAGALLVLIVAFDWRFAVLWNPFPAALAIIPMLTLAWAVAVGRSATLPWFVFAMSAVAQLQLATTPVAAITLIVLFAWVWTRRRRGVRLVARRDRKRALIVLAVCWSGPLLNVISTSPNNIGEMWRYLTYDGDGGTPRSFALPSADVWAVVCGAAVVALALWLRSRRPQTRADLDLYVPGIVFALFATAVAALSSASVASADRSYYGLYTYGTFLALIALTVWTVLIVAVELLPQVRGRAKPLLVPVVVAAVVTAGGVGWVKVNDPIAEAYKTEAYFSEQEYSQGLVAAIDRELEPFVQDAQPIEIRGEGWISVFSLAPAVFSDQVAQGRKAHFDLPWPFPVGDDYRRVKNIWGERLVVLMEARDSRGQKKLAKPPRSVLAHAQLPMDGLDGAVTDVYIFREG